MQKNLNAVKITKNAFECAAARFAGNKKLAFSFFCPEGSGQGLFRILVSGFVPAKFAFPSPGLNSFGTYFLI